MIYETQKHHGVIVGSDFIVCELCALEKAGEKHITVAKAKRELMGNYVGQHFLKIGDLYICEDCLRKTLEEIDNNKLVVKAHKIAIGDVDDEEEPIVEEAPVEEKPKTRGRKKKTDED